MSEHDTPPSQDEPAGASTTTDPGPRPPGQRPTRLVRLPDEGPGAGVAAGLGAYFGIDPVLFRIAFVVLTLAGGSGLMLYVIGWLVIPAAAPGEAVPRPAVQGSDRTGQWVGIGLILAAALWLSGPFHMGGSVLWALALLAVGIILFREDANRRSGGSPAAQGGGSAAGGPSHGGATPTGGQSGGAASGAARASSGATANAPPSGQAAPAPGEAAPEGPAEADVGDETAVLEEAARLREGGLDGWSAGGWDPPDPNWSPVPPAAPPRPQRSLLGRATLGLSLVAVGVLALADNLSPAVGIAPARYVALVLLIIGGGLLVGSWRGRARGLIPVGLLLLPLLAATTLFQFGAPWQGGVGERMYNPTDLEEVRDEYRLGTGQLLVDLSHVDFAAQEQSVSARVGFGQLDVVVPPDVDVTVNASTNAGELDLFGETARGNRLGRTVTNPGPGEGTLNLDLEAGLGQVLVRRADG